MTRRAQHTQRGASFLLLAVIVSGGSAYLNVGDILWQDNFDGDTVKENHWSYDIGNGCPNNCGWGNSELQHYTDHPDNVKVEDDKLHITARRVMVQQQANDPQAAARFTSARIKTQDKVLVKYGQIEARIQVPDLVEGLWPAFWTLGANFDSVGWPACGEMDVLEMGSGASLAARVGNQRVTSGAHWSQADGSLAAYSLHPDYPRGTLNGTYVTWRLDWTPDSISTSIVHDDPTIGDFPIWKMDIDPVSCPDCSEFHQEHFFILNLAVGGMYTTYYASDSASTSSSSSSSSGCGSPSSSGGSSSSSFSSGGCGMTPREDVSAPLPASMKVDWIRVIQNGFSEVRVTTTPSPTDSSTSSPTKTPTSAPIQSWLAVSYPTRPPTPTPSSSSTQSPTSRSSVRGADSRDTLLEPTSSPTDGDGDNYEYNFSADYPGRGSEGDDDDDDGKGKGGKGKGGKYSKKSKSCKSSKSSKSSPCNDPEEVYRLQSSALGFSAAGPTKAPSLMLALLTSWLGTGLMLVTVQL